LTTSSSARFGAASPSQFCEKYRTSSKRETYANVKWDCFSTQTYCGAHEKTWVTSIGRRRNAHQFGLRARCAQDFSKQVFKTILDCRERRSAIAGGRERRPKDRTNAEIASLKLGASSQDSNNRSTASGMAKTRSGRSSSGMTLTLCDRW
jgi:hypothetical protein